MHNCISKFILFLDTFILEPLHSIFLPLQFEFVLLGLNQNLDVLLKWRPWHPNFSIKIVCFFEIGSKCLTKAPRTYPTYVYSENTFHNELITALAGKVPQYHENTFFQPCDPSCKAWWMVPLLCTVETDYKVVGYKVKSNIEFQYAP